VEKGRGDLAFFNAQVNGRQSITQKGHQWEEGNGGEKGTREVRALDRAWGGRCGHKERGKRRNALKILLGE